MMKATKYTLDVHSEGLSKEVFYALLHRVAEEFAQEVTSGRLQMDDGDLIEWHITSVEVTF